MNGENIDKMASIAPSQEELAPYASLRGPDAAVNITLNAFELKAHRFQAYLKD